MSLEKIKLTMFPVMAETVSDGMLIAIKEKVVAAYPDTTDEDFSAACAKRFTKPAMKKSAGTLEAGEAAECFNLAKALVSVGEESMKRMEALSELGSALGIEPDDTGFDFDLFAEEALINFEYKKTLLNFSMIAAAVGFIPVPFADMAILTTMQIAMVTKIATLYKFDFNAQKFLKLLGGTVGAGFMLRLTAKLIGNMIPLIGWIVNASVAFAGTYAIGVLARHYAEARGELSSDTIKKIWEESFKDGKTEFSKMKEYILSRKDDLIREFKKYANRDEESESTGNENTGKQKGETPSKKTSKKTKSENQEKPGSTDREL
jgi:uncharacterized protein (DUF697 family)